MVMMRKHDSQSANVRPGDSWEIGTEIITQCPGGLANDSKSRSMAGLIAGSRSNDDRPRPARPR